MEIDMKNLRKTFYLICCITMLLSCPVTLIPVHAAESSASIPANVSEGETIQPRAAIIEWVFLEVDGKMYRRLYNYQTKEWIGDWILCE